MSGPNQSRMRWHCLQHVPFENPAHLATWVHREGFLLTRTRLWKNFKFPTPDEFDGLFVLGGPMNVYEDSAYPWLGREKDFIERAVSDGKPVVGVCLGAQLLSLVLGGSVNQMYEMEIGWFPVELTQAGCDLPLLHGFPNRFMAFHWHGDCFSIPPGAVHIARSDACEQQAFQYENHVVGLQFHLELSREGVAALVRNCGADLSCGPYIQDPHSIEECTKYFSTTQRLLFTLLDNLMLSSGLLKPAEIVVEQVSESTASRASYLREGTPHFKTEQ